MKAGYVKRGFAVAILLVCVVALPGQAGADDAQKLSITGPAAVGEGGTATFTISLTAGTDANADVTYATQDGSAEEGADYVENTGTVTVPAGGSVTVDVAVSQDPLDEAAESFSMELSSPQRATIETGTATATITDDDATPKLAISGPTNVDEVAGNANYSVAITGQSASTVTVNFATANGSAAAGSDYTSPSGAPLSWASGDTSTKSITVPILHDTLDEIDESFSVNLASPSNAEITTGTVTTSITDNDNPPTVTAIVDVEVIEGDTTANLLVRLSGPSGKNIAINYQPGEGGSATAGSDYVAPSGRLEIPAGSTDLEHEIPVVIKQDILFEGDETLFVNLFAHENVGPGLDLQGKVTIKDDADPATAPTVSSPSVAEGNSGLKDLVFEVTLQGPHPQVNFNYRTVAGTATSLDYTEIGGAQVSFPANPSASPTTRPATVQVKGELLDENHESFTLELLNPSTGVVVATATGTITNDDNNTEIQIADASADEPSTGTATLTFAISLSVASGRAVSVGWQTANGTAAAGTDYNAASGNVSFAPGETTKAIEVTVIGDTVNEPNETVLVNFTGSGANLIDAQAQGTIIDKNAPPSLSISDALAREGGGASFTVELAGTTLQTVTVGFSTGDGSAREPGDYTARRGTLTFAPGEKSKTLVVSVVDDTLAETLETFFVSLGDPVNGAITKSRGTATIEASDQVATSGNGLRPPATPGASPTLLPKMVLAPRTVNVTRTGFARLFLTCTKLSPIACRGSITLQTTGKPPVKLGSKTFLVAKGKKKTLGVKLSPRARKLLAKRPTLRARVVVLVKTGKKSLRVVPGVITLKAAPKSTKPKSAKKSMAPKDAPPKVTVRP